MRSFWIALIVSSCAARAAVEQPSSQPFRVVESGRCTPEIDGVWLSWSDARAVIVRREADELQHKLKLIDVERQRDDAQAQVRELAKSMPDGFLARWGLMIGVGTGAAVTAIMAALLFGFSR